MRRMSFGVLVLLACVLAGCAASPPVEATPSHMVHPLASMPPKIKLGNEGWRPTKPLPRIELTDEEKAHYRKTYLEGLGDDEHPVNVDELPELVTYISRDELGSVMHECLRQAGWESKVSLGGAGLEIQAPPEQWPQITQVQIECQAMYTIDPRRLKWWAEVNPTRAEGEIYYEYYQGFLSQCLARFGYQLKLPSKEVYIAEFMARKGTDVGYPSDDKRVRVACPDDPPEEVMLGGP